MAIIHLYCQETPGLKLGPESEIVFSGGYADVDTEEFPKWDTWVFHPGTPHIRVLDADEATSAATATEHACPQCGKAFATERGLNGHLLSHRAKK